MPNINITEVDFSKVVREYANFSVVIPGLYKEDSAVGDGSSELIDDNHVIELSTLKQFESEIGYVVPTAMQADDGTEYFHYGNQMAYECIKAGYTVLYIALDSNALLASLESPNTFEPLEDKSEYDFRFITNGLLSHNSKANANIIKVAATRGDCTAICDLNEQTYTASTITTKAGLKNALISAANSVSTTSIGDNNGKYCALVVPSLCYDIKDSNYYASVADPDSTQNKFPAAMHYLLCAAYNRINSYDEWFANAGETRGVCNYNILSTSVSIGETIMQALEPRTAKTEETGYLKYSVNPIVTFRGNHYLWGNRTAHPLKDGLVYSHFLNIRQLCSTLKKQIYVTCKGLMFDPNSDVLWTNFCEAVRPILERMKANQGIVDYRFVKVATKEKGKLVARVRIIPIEAVEDFDIEVALEEEFGAASATLSEE